MSEFLLTPPTLHHCSYFWKMFYLFSGMNGNKRVISRHVEYEPVTYNAAYSIEIEAAAAPMWSLIAASSVLVS